MAPRLRKTSSSSSVEKSKKGKKAQKEMENTTLAANKYAGIFGLFILLFGLIYIVLFGRYVYKRKTGSPSALNQTPNPFNFANLDMEAFKKAIKVDENGKVTFTQEDLEKLKEVFVDVNGNAQVPPKDTDENNKESVEDNKETVEEVGNEESGANAEAEAAQAAEGEATTDEKKKNSNEGEKLREKRSVNYADGNSYDEAGEMSDSLSNLLTRGPSASFVDRLRNKIVILNPDIDGMDQANIGSTHHVRSRRSINQHMYSSGSNSNNNICHNINSMETNICY